MSRLRSRIRRSASSLASMNAESRALGDSAAAGARGDCAAARVRGDCAAARVSGDSTAARVRGDSTAARVRGDSAAARVLGDLSRFSGDAAQVFCATEPLRSLVISTRSRFCTNSARMHLRMRACTRYGRTGLRINAPARVHYWVYLCPPSLGSGEGIVKSQLRPVGPNMCFGPRKDGSIGIRRGRGNTHANTHACPHVYARLTAR